MQLYLNQSGCETVRGIDDTADFNDVCLALSQLGFVEEELDELFGLICAVLHLGTSPPSRLTSPTLQRTGTP